MKKIAHRAMTGSLLGLAASVFLTASGAAAEETKDPVTNPFEIGVFGGVHIFNKKSGLGRYVNSPTGISPDSGGAFGLRLTYNLNEWIGAEAEAAITPTRLRDDSTSVAVLGYRASAIATLYPHGYAQPFVLAGYGALSSFPGDTTIVSQDTDGMFHLGIGAKFPIMDNFGLRLDGRIMVPGAIASDIVEVGTETHYDGPDFEILLAGYMGFGATPPAPPPPPPPAPKVDLDPDRDGILGAADKCPDKAEDKDGFEDEDGCPELDNDQDGINDIIDKCPNEAEDKDGFEDEDGCPELDNDKDGINDDQDKCPTEPETVNNYQDEDGCPDEVPAAVQKFTGVIKGINFKNGSAKINRGSRGILDKALRVLNDYPDVRLEISGHTDNRGKEDYNKDLSQRRADAVRDYLVSKGIDPDRLTAVGYGMDKPLTSNKTRQDRAKNRRTEFQLIKK